MKISVSSRNEYVKILDQILPWLYSDFGMSHHSLFWSLRWPNDPCSFCTYEFWFMLCWPSWAGLFQTWHLIPSLRYLSWIASFFNSHIPTQFQDFFLSVWHLTHCHWCNWQRISKVCIKEWGKYQIYSLELKIIVLLVSSFLLEGTFYFWLFYHCSQTVQKQQKCYSLQVYWH